MPWTENEIEKGQNAAGVLQTAKQGKRREAKIEVKRQRTEKKGLNHCKEEKRESDET